MRRGRGARHGDARGPREGLEALCAREREAGDDVAALAEANRGRVKLISEWAKLELLHLRAVCFATAQRNRFCKEILIRWRLSAIGTLHEIQKQRPRPAAAVVRTLETARERLGSARLSLSPPQGRPGAGPGPPRSAAAAVHLRWDLTVTEFAAQLRPYRLAARVRELEGEVLRSWRRQELAKNLLLSSPGQGGPGAAPGGGGVSLDALRAKVGALSVRAFSAEVKKLGLDTDVIVRCLEKVSGAGGPAPPRSVKPPAVKTLLVDRREDKLDTGAMGTLLRWGSDLGTLVGGGDTTTSAEEDAAAGAGGAEAEDETSTDLESVDSVEEIIAQSRRASGLSAGGPGPSPPRPVAAAAAAAGDQRPRRPADDAAPLADIGAAFGGAFGAQKSAGTSADDLDAYQSAQSGPASTEDAGRPAEDEEAVDSPLLVPMRKALDSMRNRSYLLRAYGTQ